MIQLHGQLKRIIETFAEENPPPGMFQKMFSTTAFVCITIRFRGSTKYLYVGRGSGFEGVWPGGKAPPAAMRTRDRFLEYLRKHLTSNYIRGISVDPHDRLLTLKYGRRDVENVLMLYWCGRQLYFLHYFAEEDEKNGKVETTRRLFLSWQGYAETSEGTEERLKDFFNFLGRKRGAEGQVVAGDKGALVSTVIPIEKILEEEETRFAQKGEKEKRKHIKFLERKRLKIGLDLHKNEGWKKLETLIKDEETPLDLMVAEEMPVGPVLFKFKKEWNNYRRMDAVYEKLKKLRRGEGIQRKRLEEVVGDILKEREMVQNAPEGSLGFSKAMAIKTITPVWYNPKNQKMGKLSNLKDQPGTADSSDQIILEMEIGNGIKVGVGKSDRGNDYLRNTWGAKDHLWFHLEGHTGAHCVAKVVALGQLSERQLRLIGSILRDQSRTTLIIVPLVYTQLKNIKGVKGSAGKVLIKKEKFYSVEYLENWRKEIQGH